MYLNKIREVRYSGLEDGRHFTSVLWPPLTELASSICPGPLPRMEHLV